VAAWLLKAYHGKKRKRESDERSFTSPPSLPPLPPSLPPLPPQVILSKAGSHFLDEEEDFYTMREALVDVVDHYFEYDLTTTASG